MQRLMSPFCRFISAFQNNIVRLKNSAVSIKLLETETFSEPRMGLSRDGMCESRASEDSLHYGVQC